MDVPGPVSRTRPDSITLWPTEAGSYGIQVRWGGPEGLGQATSVRDAVRSSGMQAKLIQEGDAGWAVNVGPLARDQAKRVVDTFLV
ncbi:MAG TPA: hypothetical protein VGF21_00300 [Thermoleophilaceae bacterium]|jgi:hypothetical protein